MKAGTGRGDPSRRALVRAAGAGLGLALGGGALAACSPRPPARPGQEDARLNFYNLDSNIGQTTLAAFKEASGVDVAMSLFTDDDDLFARLKAGNPGFDLIAPSNIMMTRMAQDGLLTPLDHNKLPNIANLRLRLQNPSYDPGSVHSAAYTWRVLGIGYRKSKVLSPPDSWASLFASPDYSGRIAVLAKPDELVRCCAKALGQSVNNISDATLSQIEAMLIAQKPNIKAFHQDDGQNLLLAGDVDLVLEYNDDIAHVMRRDSDLAFVVPKEGSLMSTVCLCIPVGAARPNNAHALINYLLDAKVGADIAETLQTATPNEAARVLMDDKYKNNPVLFPPTDLMAKCEFATYEGDARAKLYSDLVARVRAA